MEKIFKKFQEIEIVHLNYKGILCGYDESRFILAVETKDDKNFWKKMRKEDNTYILEKYKDSKYRYIYENETELEKQFKNNL